MGACGWGEWVGGTGVGGADQHPAEAAVRLELLILRHIPRDHQQVKVPMPRLHRVQHRAERAPDVSAVDEAAIHGDLEVVPGAEVGVVGEDVQVRDLHDEHARRRQPALANTISEQGCGWTHRRTVAALSEINHTRVKHQ